MEGDEVEDGLIEVEELPEVVEKAKL